MLTDEQYLAVGQDLEAAGLSHAQIDAYFEHHGVKGQKWGIRNAKNRVDGVLAGKAYKNHPGFNRQGRTASGTGGRYQSRSARNVKRVAAAIILPGIGDTLYNTIAKPLDPKSPLAKKTQSGTAFTVKLVAAGVLGTPLAAINYYQIAKPVRPPGSPGPKPKPIPMATPKPTRAHKMQARNEAANQVTKMQTAIYTKHGRRPTRAENQAISKTVNSQYAKRVKQLASGKTSTKPLSKMSDMEVLNKYGPDDPRTLARIARVKG